VGLYHHAVKDVCCCIRKVDMQKVDMLLCNSWLTACKNVPEDVQNTRSRHRRRHFTAQFLRKWNANMHDMQAIIIQLI
jgi:hypothetical protein